MRFHCLGLPHTVTSKDYTACAFTQKVYKFIEMMSARGHECIHYGHEDSKVNCENVVVTTNKTLLASYGSFDYRKEFFKYDLNDLAHQTFHTNAVREIQKRHQPKDILLPFWGYGHKAVCDALPEVIQVEPGIGYPSGGWLRWRVYESYAILHAQMGLKAVERANPDFYNAVIPNYFNQADFTFNDKKDDYFLFLGRVYDGKGVRIAIQVTEHLGKKLIIAGQTNGSIEFPPHVKYVGYADTETRRQLMSNAKATFCPSLYLEPFCGVAVESLFSGTPVISTDWGAFHEYLEQGVTGFRCRTFGDFVEATQRINEINPLNCLSVALRRFTYDAVAPQYEHFFKQVLDVYGGNGWYALNT